MALLAIIDVDDAATEKIKRTKNALEDLVRTAQRSAQAVAQSNAALSQSQGALGGGGGRSGGDPLGSLRQQLAGAHQAMEALEATTERLRKAQADAAADADKQGTALGNMRLQAVALAAALGVLAGSFQTYLRDAAELAARVETLGTVTQITARNAGYTTAELRVQSEAIKRLGITTVEANDAVLQFVRSNLNLADAAKLARAAQDLAVVSGENSSETYKRLTTAIQTGETMLLRQVGIVTTNEQLWAAYGRTIGKTTQQLTAAEKQQAFVNKILEEAGRVTGAYEASMDTAGKQMQSMARLTEELQLKLGQALLPTFTLIVTALYKFLGALNSLTSEQYRVIAALGAFVTAMTGVLAVITAAKWLALGSAIAALASPIGIVVGLLAALGAGYVYYNTQAGKTIDTTVQQVAAHDAMASAIEKSYEKYQKLTDAGTQLALADGAATKEQIELKKSTDDLAKAVPTAIEQFDKLTGTYKLNVGEIENVIRANARLRESYLTVAQAQIEDQKKRVADLAKQRDELTKKLQQASADVDILSITDPTALVEGAQKSIGSKYGRGTPTLAQALGYDKLIDTVKREKERLAEELKATIKDLGTAEIAVKNSTDIIAEFGGNIPDRLQRVREGVTKGWAGFVADAKKFNIDISKALNPGENVDMGAYRQLLVGLQGDIQKASDKQMRQQQQYTQAFESALQNIRSSGVATTAQLAAVNKGLGEVAEGSEEYRIRVQRAAGAIAQFNKSSEGSTKGLTNLAKAAEFLKSVELAKWANGIEESFDKMALSAGEALNKISTGLSGEVTQMFRERGEQEFALRREVADKIDDLDKEIADRRAERTLDGVDLAIYQENRRVQEIEKAIEREIEARERAQKKAEDLFEDRVRQAQAEAREVARSIKLQIDLLEERTAAEINFARVAGTISDEVADQRLARLAEMRAAAKADVDERLRFRQEEINAEAEVGRRRLQQSRELNEALAKDQRSALDRQKQASAETVQQMRRDNGVIFQLTRDLSMNLANSVTKGFLDILTQARSTKDAFVGIIRSMADTVLNIIQDMISQWIRKAALLATSNGGFNVGTFFKAFAGMAGGGGGMQSVAGLTGGYSNLTMQGGQLGMSGAAGAGGSGAGAALAGGAMAAGGGYAVGSLLASKFGRDSYFHSGGIGAASGAATGAAIGSVVPGIGTGVGAGVGAIAGAIGGWLQERKRRKELMAERDQIIKDMGGLDEFKRKAEEAGVALDKFLDTKKSKVYAEELNKIQKAFVALDVKKFIEAQGGMDAIIEKAKTAGIELTETFKNGTGEAAEMQRELEKVAKALQLQEAKEGLAQTVTQMDNLRKRAVLAGYDLRKLYETKTIEEFNNEQAKFNKLLEEQQRRLAGLGTAAAGIQQRVKGLQQTLAMGFKDVFSTLGKQGQEEFTKAFEEAQKGGYTGGPLKFMLENMDKFKQSMAEATGLFDDMQEGVNRVGGYISGVFGGVLRETGDIMAAFNAISGSLDDLAQIVQDTGVEASGTLKWLLQFRTTIKDNEDVANSLSGINQILKGMSDSGRLTVQMFNDLGADAADQWALLKERGVAADQALMLMQPTLQSLYEAQKNFGFQTDEATQALIDMGIANGVVGDQFQSVNQKMLDILVLIADVLGADIPEAYRKQESAAADAQQAAQEAAKAQEAAANNTVEIGDKVDDAAGSYGDWRDNIQTVREKTEGLDLVMEKTQWEKPGERATEGLVEMNMEFARSKDVVKDFADYAVEQLERVVSSASAISLGHSPGGLKEIRIKTRDALDAFVAMRRGATRDLGVVERSVNAVNGALDAASESGGAARWRARADAEGTADSSTIQVTMPEVKVSISAVDADGMDRVYAEKIHPKIVHALETNAQQFASRVAKASKRY